MNIKIDFNVDRWKTRLQKAWDENPALCLTAAATALTAAAKLAQLKVEHSNSKSWKKEVARRERADRLR